MKIPSTYGLSKDIIQYIEEGASQLQISKSAYVERVILEHKTLKSTLQNVDISTLRIEAQPSGNSEQSNVKPQKDELSQAITNSIADIFNTMK